ncbi:DUF1365 family protein [Pseudomonas laurylsulfativorans]|uniref:DUF1365 domain-containing protein n=1 Tax=Pseudomonas laurylsulfativorans TaxID=1943631 RepID=UPI00209F00AE|nr:DUF1365 family protein [Pseudomonas laurylsulfativorans]
MNSALYRGWVSHRRLLPRIHGFRYRMGMLYLDLAEQPQVLGLSWLAGHSRWGAFSFRETDYLPHATRQGVTLSDAVREQVKQALGHAPQGRICLLTQPRSWGVSFNPISLFYCFESDGSLGAILCEVSNTPWRERYHYVLPTHPSGESRHRVAKSFHVSPFLPRNLEYRMRFSAPDQKLQVTMQDWQGEQKIFEAGLGLERIELTQQSLHRHLLDFPWMTGKTLLGIYWQALRLLLKRLPLFSHEATSGQHRTANLESRHDKS